jgi:hypothetical protein
VSPASLFTRLFSRLALGFRRRALCRRCGKHLFQRVAEALTVRLEAIKIELGQDWLVTGPVRKCDSPAEAEWI